MCHTISKFLIVEDLFIESLSELSSVLNDYITEDRHLKSLAFDSKVYINIESIYQVASILKNIYKDLRVFFIFNKIRTYFINKEIMEKV